MLRTKNIFIDGKVAIRDVSIGASQASNPSNSENCTPQKNPKKPRPR
jgi:hypothetical protein